MLSLLMSTYGNAVRQNKKLIDTQARLEQLNTSLETAVRDRTDQLVRAERGYRRFLENTHSGFYRVNAGGKIVEANSALVNMLGYGSRQELYELESAESMYRGGPAMARILRDGRPNGAFPTHKSVLLTRNGEEIHVLENIFVQTDRAGQVEYVDGLVDDITQIEAYGERMTTLSHLVRIANSRLDFESILGALSTHLGETFPAAYICACIRDEDAGTFHVVTPQGVSTSAEGLDGANPLSTKQLHECLATGRTIYSASIGGPRGDGGTPGDGEILSAVMVPISASEKAIGVLVVGRDREAAISADDIRFLENVAGHLGIAIHNSRLYGELKDAYQLLQETQGQIIQQERMRAIGEMASGIAHDFNNSLTSVLGFTELILNDEHVRRDEARVCEFLGHVRDAALDGQEIVGRLREFYRTREHDETFEAVDLNEVVEKAISLTRPKWFNQAQERGVPIEIDRELDPECTVSGSFTSIREVLTNLIFNSVDAVSEHYTASRPDPAYRPRIRIQTRSDGERVYLVVSDNGPGMSEDVKKRCFEPFFTTKGEHGSGLGLGMVYGIVQRLEGSIEIESEPGSGTAMTISLPAAGTCRKTERETEVDAGALRGVRVLAVDDNPKVCLMLSNMLQGAGMRVDVAGSGADALELFREHRHDLVITDKGMIGMRGDELAAEIKRIDPATPVAMMTGYGALMLAQGEKPEHVDLVLTKPVQQQQLIGAIHALVSAAAATG
jgi:PAS domain S-box-containing protein